MKIGILGSGEVGRSLAVGFLKHNYEVMIGTRDKNKLEKFKEETKNKVLVGNFNETAKFGEVVVLAVKGLIAKGKPKNKFLNFR